MAVDRPSFFATYRNDMHAFNRTPTHSSSTALLAATLLALLLTAGCASNPPQPATSEPTVSTSAPESSNNIPAADTRPAPAATKPDCPPVEKSTSKPGAKKHTKGKKAPAPAAADCRTPTEAAAASANSRSKPAPATASTPNPNTSGYDLSKNRPVTDSSKVSSGEGTQVTGLNDWQGEITGLPAANSKLTRLKIGMPQQQVLDLIGQPTDQGAYITGKAFIPFYFGSDKSRWEMVYKGQGRLIFSNQSGFGSAYYLTWIIHNANEAGYR